MRRETETIVQCPDRYLKQNDVNVMRSDQLPTVRLGFRHTVALVVVVKESEVYNHQ